MNHRKNVCILLFLLVLPLLIPSLRSEASSKKVLVAYTRDIFSMVITAEGQGILKDGEQEIREGSVEYNLLYGTRKEFVIQADPGYKLTGLSYKRPDVNEYESIDILSRVDADGKFWIVVEDTKIELTATFEKIDDGSGDNSGGDGDNGGSGNGGSGSGSGTSGGTDSKPSGGSGTSSGMGGKPSGGRPFHGTGPGSAGQTSASSGTGTKTGDHAMTEWYLLLMLTAVAAMIIITAKKRKNVYKEPQ